MKRLCSTSMPAMSRCLFPAAYRIGAAVSRSAAAHGRRHRSARYAGRLGGRLRIAAPNRAFSPTAYNSGGAGMSGTVGDYARFLQMLLNEGELEGVRVLRADTVRQMTQNATGNMPTLRGPGWGYTLGFGILIDPAAAKSRLPAGSYGWGGIYGTQFWVDPTNRVVGLVMTQTAIIGSGAISNPIREAFYTVD